MALTSYTELKAAIADWLNRNDMTSSIAGDMIPLCEAEMKRRIRRTTNSTTIYISAGNMDGPTDMASPIALHLSTGSPSLDVPLRLCTPEMLAERVARANGVQGRPDSYAFYDSQLQFAPVPDQSYDGILLYNVQLTPLSGSVASNTILVEAPDAYLYGSLAQAVIYLEHEERLPPLERKFNAAIDQLNAVREEEEYRGGQKEARLPVVFCG